MLKALFDSAKNAVDVVTDAVENAQNTVTHPTPRNTHEDSVEDEVAKIDSRGGKVQLPSVRVESSSPEDYDFITKESVEDEIPLLHTPGYTSSFSAYSAEDTPKEESFVHVRTVEDTLKSVGTSLLDKARAGAIAVGEGLAQVAKETSELAGSIEKIETNEEKKPKDSVKEEALKVGEELQEAAITETVITKTESVPDNEEPNPEEAVDKSECVCEVQDIPETNPVCNTLNKKTDEYSSVEETLRMDRILDEFRENQDETREEFEYPLVKTTENEDIVEKISENQEKEDIKTPELLLPTEAVLEQLPCLVEDEPVCQVQDKKEVQEPSYEPFLEDTNTIDDESSKEDDLNLGEKVLNAGDKIISAALDKAQDVNEKIEDILYDEPREVGSKSEEKKPSCPDKESKPMEEPMMTEPMVLKPLSESGLTHDYYKEPEHGTTSGTVPGTLEIITEVTELSVFELADPQAPPTTDESAAQTEKGGMIEIDPEGSWPDNCSNLVMDVVFEGAGHNRATAATVCQEKQETSQ